MAKLTGPLMSFGASGQLGKTLVLGSWKGVNTARQYVIPSNPRSVGQLAQRALMTSVVNAWRNPLLTALVKAAWNKLAAAKSAAISGFNSFVSNLVKLAAEDPDASIAVSAEGPDWNAVAVTMKNLDDFATGDEAGNFAVVFGATADQLVYSATATIAAGVITVDATDATNDAAVLFVAIRKAGTGSAVYERSGIMEIPITA